MGFGLSRLGESQRPAGYISGEDITTPEQLRVSVLPQLRERLPGLIELKHRSYSGRNLEAAGRWRKEAVRHKKARSRRLRKK